MFRSFLVLVLFASISAFADVEIAESFSLTGQCVHTQWQGNGQNVKATCPNGYHILSGGCRMLTVGQGWGAEDLLNTYPDFQDNAWHCLTSVGTRKATAMAVCCR